jgi:hypothetical protein
MIQEFVDRFMVNKPQLEARFKEAHPADYMAIVRGVVEIVSHRGYGEPDPDRIHVINDGSYQGTMIFIIGSGGHSPEDYWYVRVHYGSCSGCDTLQALRGWDDDAPPDSKQVEGYMTLALHVLQGLKKLGDD